jgi:hypothetical protein
MLLMAIGKRRISSAVRVLVEQVERVTVQAVAELGLGPVLAELEHGPVAAELEHGPVAVELEHVQAVAELEHVQAVAELGLVQAAAELELGPVAAEPVLGHPRAQLVVALRTKSVTAAHPHDLVPLLAVAEDLAAAAAETTREPAAAEAVIAWEVAE